MKRIFLFLMLLFMGAIPAYAQTSPAPQKCAQIYYDHGPLNTDAYTKGSAQAIALQNLISHFPNVQQYIIPIELYQPGQLNHCAANFYIGSSYNSAIPQTFLKDFVTTKKPVAWLGYNIWKLSSQDLKKIFSAEYIDVYKPNLKDKDAAGLPGVYQYFDYKGQTFERCKYPTTLSSTANIEKYYSAAFDIVRLKLSRQSIEKNVISWARHSTQNLKTPFILKQDNHWFVAENPFKFVCEGDRYFIIADILFDILDEKPESSKKYALVRYEDVSPKQTTRSIKTITNIFADAKIPFTISLIPIYTDPFKVYRVGDYKDLNSAWFFAKTLKYAEKHGANFILHGVTHQYDHQKNPFSGVSGEDYEFWDFIRHAPIHEDSVPYVLDRLTTGMTLVNEAKFKISAWMTPHYVASSLDNTIFGQVFSWNVGRGNYTVSKICNLTSLPLSLTFDQGTIDPKSNAERLNALAKLKVTEIQQNGTSYQIFPYPLYGDYYGRRMIPEDLGNIQPFLSNQVTNLRTVDDIIKDAKKYTVLRDTWASFFIHDILLNTIEKKGLANKPGDTSELKRLITSIQALGYEFVDLKKWTEAHLQIRAPRPIELDPDLTNCGS